jgi:hypothetical protein
VRGGGGERRKEGLSELNIGAHSEGAGGQHAHRASDFATLSLPPPPPSFTLSHTRTGLPLLQIDASAAGQSGQTP